MEFGCKQRDKLSIHKADVIRVEQYKWAFLTTNFKHKLAPAQTLLTKINSIGIDTVFSKTRKWIYSIMNKTEVWNVDTRPEKN